MTIAPGQQPPDDFAGAVPTLEARAFQYALSSGRTKPCVFECVDPEGGNAGEYVVKFRSQVNNNAVGLLCELVASCLAKRLGLRVPDPAVVSISHKAAQAIPNREVREVAEQSIGTNFGSRFCSGGYTTWPKNQSIPEYLTTQALHVFIFDAIADNPDRSADRPNLLWKSNELLLIDHETAFSFMYAIGSNNPLDVQRRPYLRKHLFHKQLCGLLHDYQPMQERLGAFTEEDWRVILECIPGEWRGPEMEQIRDHLLETASQHETFIRNIQKVLR